MIAVDTQILVYAHRGDSPFHHEAFAALRTLSEGGKPWAIVVQSLHEFISTVTHPRRFLLPSSLEDALLFVNALISSPSLRLIAEGPAHWETLERLLRAGKVVGPQVHDARIATVCLQHGVQMLWTCDRDFQSFPQLSTSNPCVRFRT